MVSGGSRVMQSMMGYMPRPRMPMYKPFPVVNSQPEEIILGKKKKRASLRLKNYCDCDIF
jgi:hypothetical protein